MSYDLWGLYDILRNNICDFDMIVCDVFEGIQCIVITICR